MITNTFETAIPSAPVTENPHDLDLQAPARSVPTCMTTSGEMGSELELGRYPQHHSDGSSAAAEAHPTEDLVS